MGIGALSDAIDALEHTPYDDEIIEKLACLDRLYASIITDLDRFDRDGMYAVVGCPNLRNWLTFAANRTGRDAGYLVATMKLLRSLPETAEAFASGGISKGHVDVIASNVTDETLGMFAEVEAEMTVAFTDLPVRDTAMVMRQWARKAEDRKRKERPGRTEPEVDQVHLSETLGGRSVLDGTLTGENAKVVRAALDLCLPANLDGEPIKTFSQRQAEALVEMARRVLQITDSTVTRSADVTVVVNMHDVINGGSGWYGDGTFVPSDRVQKLLCDAVITPLAVGDAGEPLWMGRQTRTATNGQRRALLARDRCCRYPGCGRQASWCDAHHVAEWERDHGPTDIDNLVLLCSYHHGLIHKPGWHAKLLPDATLEITLPSGRTLRSPPPSRLDDLIRSRN